MQVITAVKSLSARATSPQKSEFYNIHLFLTLIDERMLIFFNMPCTLTYMPCFGQMIQQLLTLRVLKSYEFLHYN